MQRTPNDMLNGVKKIILSERDLGKALSQLQCILPANPSDMSIVSRLNDIEANYQLMCDYMLRGYKDAQAANIYNRLLRQTFEVCQDLELQKVTQSCISLMRAQVSANSLTCKLEHVKDSLEQFVQDIAFISLSSEEEKNKAALDLYATHQKFTSMLFNSIVVSRQWNNSKQYTFEEILLSPLIDTNDLVQIASAIMLATIKIFDVNKWLTLTNVYENAKDESVRQRCLIGWVLSLPLENNILFPEIDRRISELTKIERVRKELLELQMQLFYCCNTEADNETIQRDIIPSLIKNNDIIMSRTGIVEKEDDALNDILDPEATNRRMENMENSFKRMMDMQKSGSDIYFGGFSQMKRFGFFEQMSNWFCPYYPEHPQLQKDRKRLQNEKFMQAVLLNGPFCDSDKYSFAIALASIIERLPDNVREMLGNDSSFGGGVISDEERVTPAYIRRMYLQDAYRFFRLFQYKDDFPNPFDKPIIMFFFTHSLFKDTMVQERNPLVKFLYKHRYFADIIKLDAPTSDNILTISTVFGMAYLQTGDFTNARKKFESVLQKDNHNIQALSGLAKACFSLGDYQKAVECYTELVHEQAENLNFVLNLSIAQICVGEISKGLSALHRLNYEMPDNLNVKRAIAWGYLLNGNAEKAERSYDILVANPNSIPADFLNAAYAKWFQRKIKEAIMLFKLYLTKRQDTERKDKYSILDDFKEDEQLLGVYEISCAEQHIMLDLVMKK